MEDPVFPGTFRRLATATLAVAVGASLLAGCGKGGSSSSSGSSGGGTLTLWTHNAGNAAELGAINAIVKDYNASQQKYKVVIQAFPQTSYNQSVVAAATAKKLPCILDIDGPNVPDWAWAGYLSPLTGLDDTVAKFLPSTVGKYNGKNYSVGFYDVALSMYALKSVLNANKIRIPTIDTPWSETEFTAALKTLKATGKWAYPLDLGTAGTGEWIPYAYSPFLQSFGGDLISRTDYKSADGVLNGPKAVAWAKWFRGLVTDKYMAAKSGADSTADFVNGKSAIMYSGSWAAETLSKKFGKDVAFIPPPNLGNGPKIGGGSWEWGVSAGCSDPAGALDYLKYSLQDKYVAAVSKATGTIPATDAAAGMLKGYEAGGVYDFFRQESKKFAVLRPVTPGYPFIATEYAKATQDILNGADPKSALDQAVSNIDANNKSNNFFAAS
jgi:multiple sugar transport system substrate-binding protein